MADPRAFRIAFQGEAGAFSEQAARAALTGAIVPVACRTFDAMFEAVRGGRADAAIAPIENTLAGSILKTYDLLIEHDLTVVAEVTMRIEHNLLAHPGVALADLRRVHSHPVALAQCERFLDAHPHLAVVEAYDTAGSVKDLMTSGKRDEAAIAGEAAAARYGAAIVVAGIESNKQNFTRFFILLDPKRAPRTPLPLRTPGSDSLVKTSIAFGLAHKPGGLHEALGAFAQEKVDLTKIESRPLEGRPWEYSFYLDLVGSAADGPVARALDRLRAGADFVRVLGSYPTLKV